MARKNNRVLKKTVSEEVVPLPGLKQSKFTSILSN